MEAGSTRLDIIGCRGQAIALALWAPTLGWLPQEPHFAGLPSRVFYSIPELRMWSSLHVNPTCGPPFVLILITPYKNRQSRNLCFRWLPCLSPALPTFTPMPPITVFPFAVGNEAPYWRSRGTFSLWWAPPQFWPIGYTLIEVYVSKWSLPDVQVTSTPSLPQP